MKIKLLPFILSCLTVLVFVTACLDSKDYDYTLSSSASILEFKIDTVKAVQYPFTIDQIKREVYNADSLPVGTDLAKIYVNTFSANGYITSADTLVNIPDTIDFTGSIDKPLEFKIISQDQENEQTYRIWINIHQVEPDTMVWKKIESSFSEGKVTGEQKTIELNGDFFTYHKGNTVYVKRALSDTWSGNALSGFPANPKVGSIVKHGNVIYTVTEDGEVYSSIDGINWSVSSLSGGVKTLITGFDSRLIGVVEESGTTNFRVSSDNNQWEEGMEPVIDGFPEDKISSVLFKNKSGKETLFIMSENPSETDTISYTWFSDDGLKWASTFELSNPTKKTCPKLENISMIWYDNLFYAFGGKGDNGFLSFYTSSEGVYWDEITSMIVFPEEFNKRGDYSFVVDEEDYLWIFWSKTSAYGDEVWKGRINRLAFDRQ